MLYSQRIIWHGKGERKWVFFFRFLSRVNLLWDLFKITTRTERMFGPGIYSTNVSSKADDYSANTGNVSIRTRVMIVNHVALGRSKMMYEASHDMQHAPQMFNSVRGHNVRFTGYKWAHRNVVSVQVTAATYPEGGKVNYHEAVVYREDAICANALIVYSAWIGIECGYDLETDGR